MNARELPQEEWASFFDGFSRCYQGRPVSVEYLGTDVGLRSGARRQPLLGITAEQTGRGPVIEILVGDSPQANLVHTVHNPSRVRIEQLDDGADGALLIESYTEPVTLVDFRPEAQVPETGSGPAV